MLKQLLDFTSASQHPREAAVWLLFLARKLKFKQMLKYHQCDTDVTAGKLEAELTPRLIPLPEAPPRYPWVFESGSKFFCMELPKIPLGTWSSDCQ